MRLLITADTHVPRRARNLPAALWDEIERADVVVHAGDWVSVDLLDAMQARSARLIGVYGNNDGPDLRARLPEVAYADLDGLRLAVVHETGPAAGREHRCAARFPDSDVLVFGHSHIPWDTTTDTGLRLFNPGSPTDRRRQPHRTWLTAEITAGALGGVTLHRRECPLSGEDRCPENSKPDLPMSGHPPTWLSETAPPSSGCITPSDAGRSRLCHHSRRQVVGQCFMVSALPRRESFHDEEHSQGNLEKAAGD